MSKNTLLGLIIITLFSACSVQRKGIDYTLNRSRMTQGEIAREESQDAWLIQEDEIGNAEESFVSGTDNTDGEEILKNNEGLPEKALASANDSRSIEVKARFEVIEEAKKYLGTPYKYGGDGPGRFDCSGFTQYCMRDVGVELARTTRFQSRQGKRIKIKDAQKGDLIFFGKGRHIQHVGIIVSNKNHELYVIHASSSRGVMIQDVLKSRYWRSRILYAVNIIGTAEPKVAISDK